MSISPRPILKRSPRKAKHAVHFPPSPSLTSTVLAHSPSSYDRTPIEVEENACALPERGCPGRTYTLQEAERVSLGRHNLGSLSLAAGRDLHPRALQKARDTASIFGPSDARTSQPSYQAGITLPPLISDVSSSETEDSDGLASPPQEWNSRYASHGSVGPEDEPSRGAAVFAPNGDQDLRTTLSFLPHALKDFGTRKSRGFKSRGFSGREIAECGSSHEKTDGLHRSHLSTALSACSLEDRDEGCLAGF
jgi:hypothetical protein